MERFDILVTDVHVATMTAGGRPYGALVDAAVGIRDGRIAWLGRQDALETGSQQPAARVVRGGGGWLTPGLVDCHTHAVFGGQRADEFERRLGGATYEEIAREGGGILSTVRATRACSEDDLVHSALRRVDDLLAEGVTTLEIKSGYGLDRDTELRMLRAARRVGEERSVDVRVTLLAAHAVPPEYAGRSADYVRFVSDELLPEAVREGRLDAVDAFCEPIAFSVDECARVFEAASGLGLPVRLHADQLGDSGGAALAARFSAASADHLEYASVEGVRAMAEAGTVAVLLPGAYHTLSGGRAPPVATFREHGVRVAVATDLNPGSSPARSLLLMLNLAAVRFGLTPEEALAGVTRNAAAALGLDGDRGSIEQGKRADLALWDVDGPGELSYWLGGNPLRWVMKDGVIRRPS